MIQELKRQKRCEHMEGLLDVAAHSRTREEVATEACTGQKIQDTREKRAAPRRPFYCLLVCCIRKKGSKSSAGGWAADRFQKARF